MGTLLTDNMRLSGHEYDIVQMVDRIAIQATWEQGIGLNGVMCIQQSLIGDLNDNNWFDIPNSAIVVSGTSGSFGWQLDKPGFRYARIKYVGAAGSALLSIHAQRVGFSQQ